MKNSVLLWLCSSFRFYLCNIIRTYTDNTRFQSFYADVLEQELKSRLGSNVNITKEIVKQIPRGPAGKFKAVINKLPLIF